MTTAPASVRPLPPAIPGPRPMFLLGWRGNVLQIARDPLRYLTDLHRAYGDVAVLVQGSDRPAFSAAARCPGTVAVFGPRYNREVLGNPDVFHLSLQTGLERTPLARLGAGMFNANGSTHRQVRRELAPSFHPRRNERRHEDVVAMTRQMLDGWRPGRRRDLFADMHRLVFRLGCKTFFGLDGTGAVDAFGELVRDWVDTAYSPAVRLLPVDLPFLPFRRFVCLSRRLDQALAALLRRERAGTGPEDDLLAALLRAGDPDTGFLTEAECVGQVLSLFIAAHDTTAAALTWTLFLLAQHPHVMADLADELAGVLGGAAPTPEQLGRLPLLENVVKESLRLLPPVPVAGRVAAEPVALGPYHLPRGTEVLYSQYVTHRLPEIYPQPLRFIPDRWARLKPSPYEYLPFGAGPRRCLGAQMALVQMQTVLALVLQRYRLELLPGARVDRRLRLTLTPRGGMPVVVREQDRRFAASRTDVRGNIREMVDFS